MILRGTEAARYLAAPDRNRAGLLIYGSDPMRVALKRQQVIAALVGPNGDAEMRLTRIAGADLRKDPALVLDAIKAVGFFPGARVAFVEDATDGLTDTLGAALKDWRDGDAQIVVAAGNLTGKSALKTLFEKHPAAVCIGLFDDPPGREEIEATLKAAGVSNLGPGAMADLTTLARELDPGDFRQMLDKISLYKWNDSTPLSCEEIAALAPATIEAEVDELVRLVAERAQPKIGPMLRRLEGQGTQAVGICIAVLRHFRSLHVIVTDPGGVAAGLQKARAFGARRDQMQRQAESWKVAALEKAVARLVDTDLALRSSSRAPAMAVMERTLLYIADPRS